MKKETSLKLEDCGTLIICATRYGQQGSKNEQEIIDVCERYINDQSIRTLNVCLEDQQFFDWIIKEEKNSPWPDWYKAVYVAKENLVKSYIKHCLTNGKKIYECFNTYSFIKFLESTGINVDVTDQEMSDCIDKYNCYSPVLVIVNRLEEKELNKVVDNYVRFAVLNKNDAKYLSPDFEEWAISLKNRSYVINAEDFESLATYALRYCMGRQTYMPSLVRDDIVAPHLSAISLTCIEQMLKDTEHQKELNLYGDSRIDKPGWLMWAETLNAEINRRRL